MTSKRGRSASRPYEKRGGYSTNKHISLSKLPKGPGPGATKKAPKSSKQK